MNSNRKQSSGFYAIVVVVLIMSLLATAQAVAAAVIPQYAPVQIGPYLVTLVGADFKADQSSDWTYKIELTEDLQNAVSHTSLGMLDPQCLIVGYSEEGPFNVEFPAMEGSQEVVKWENTTEGIKNAGEFYIFSVTILGAQVNASLPDSTYVAVKDGGGFFDGTAEGPICGTTAVSLTSVEAQSGAQSPMLMIVLALGATVATAGVLRKAGRP